MAADGEWLVSRSVRSNSG